MRSYLFALLLSGAALFAEEPAPQTPPVAEKPVPAPVEPAGPAPAKDISGSVSGNTNGPVRPVDPPKVRKESVYPREYLILVAEAMKSFKARDFAGALAYAEKADGLQGPTIWTINVRGAVAIEQLKFEEGKKLCLEALKLDPDFMPAKFNLCEIPFLQGKYGSARAGWLTLYKNTAKEDPTTELLIYRIFLTHLLEKDLKQAKEWMDKIPFPSQTPAYQYANAAWERANGREDKWKGWLESAEFIWPQVKRADFLDVLIQLKWVPANKESGDALK